MKLTVNQNFQNHNTSPRQGKIQYLVIHYVGATGSAGNNVTYYNQPSTTKASADFFVDFTGVVFQYNPNPPSRYCWAVGGGKQSSSGGSHYGTVKNSNSVSIEMCVRNRGDMSAESHDWYFEDATVESTIALTRLLMQEYHVPAEHVIRHFDVNGKLCPNPYVFNHTAHTWEQFLAAIGSASLPAAPEIPAALPVPPAPAPTPPKSVSSDNSFVLEVQAAVGTVTDGIPGPKTLGACPLVSASRNHRHKVVPILQNRLNALGFSCGTADGIAGPKLTSALKAYQSANNLAADGICGKNTWSKLLGLA